MPSRPLLAHQSGAGVEIISYETGAHEVLQGIGDRDGGLTIIALGHAAPVARSVLRRMGTAHLHDPLLRRLPLTHRTPPASPARDNPRN